MLNRERLEKAAKRAQEKLGLTDEQVDLIQNCAHSVYEEVSYDLEPDSKKTRTCKRSTIIEVVCDANRLEGKVRRRAGLSGFPTSGREVDPDENHPLVKAMEDYDLLKALIGPAFPYESYEAGPYADELR